MHHIRCFFCKDSLPLHVWGQTLLKVCMRDSNRRPWDHCINWFSLSAHLISHLEYDKNGNKKFTIRYFRETGNPELHLSNNRTQECPIPFILANTKQSHEKSKKLRTSLLEHFEVFIWGTFDTPQRCSIKLTRLASNKLRRTIAGVVRDGFIFNSVNELDLVQRRVIATWIDPLTICRLVKFRHQIIFWALLREGERESLEIYRCK